MITQARHFYFLSVSIFISVSACTSYRSNLGEVVQLNDVPVAIQPLFASCSPSDGEVNLVIEGGKIHIASITTVWNIPSEKTWDIQFNSPLGDTRMAVQRRDGQFTATGDVQLDIATDANRFMTFNDHLLPLRDSEFPCVLAGRWPVEWFQFLHTERRASGFLKLIGQDDVRSIDLKTTFSADGRAVDSCAVIQWGGFLGLFKHSANVCVKRTASGFNADLKGPSGYTAKWSQHRDES